MVFRAVLLPQMWRFIERTGIFGISQAQQRSSHLEVWQMRLRV
jgi:hypothetical protein